MVSIKNAPIVQADQSKIPVAQNQAKEVKAQKNPEAVLNKPISKPIDPEAAKSGQNLIDGKATQKQSIKGAKLTSPTYAPTSVTVEGQAMDFLTREFGKPDGKNALLQTFAREQPQELSRVFEHLQHTTGFKASVKEAFTGPQQEVAQWMDAMAYAASTTPAVKKDSGALETWVGRATTVETRAAIIDNALAIPAPKGKSHPTSELLEGAIKATWGDQADAADTEFANTLLGSKNLANADIAILGLAAGVDSDLAEAAIAKKFTKVAGDDAQAAHLMGELAGSYPTVAGKALVAMAEGGAKNLGNLIAAFNKAEPAVAETEDNSFPEGLEKLSDAQLLGLYEAAGNHKGGQVAVANVIGARVQNSIDNGESAGLATMAKEQPVLATFMINMLLSNYNLDGAAEERWFGRENELGDDLMKGIALTYDNMPADQRQAYGGQIYQQLKKNDLLEEAGDFNVKVPEGADSMDLIQKLQQPVVAPGPGEVTPVRPNVAATAGGVVASAVGVASDAKATLNAGVVAKTVATPNSQRPVATENKAKPSLLRGELDASKQSYVIGGGDTLGNIAKGLAAQGIKGADGKAISVQNLADWNGIKDINVIRKNATLSLSAPVQNLSDQEYGVALGETYKAAGLALSERNLTAMQVALKDIQQLASQNGRELQPNILEGFMKSFAKDAYPKIIETEVSAAAQAASKAALAGQGRESFDGHLATIKESFATLKEYGADDPAAQINQIEMTYKHTPRMQK